MGTGKKVGRLTGILKFLSAMGILRFLLQRQGYDVEQGMVLAFDENNMMNDFLRTFGNWKDVRVLSALNEENFNYEVAVYKYKKSDRPERILNFLNRTKGFPVVLVSGFIPEFLREDQNIFAIKFCDKKLESKEQQYLKLKNYVIREADYVEKRLKAILENPHRDMGKSQDIYNLLVAVLQVWFEVESMEEGLSAIASFRFNKEEWRIREYISEMERLREDYEVKDAVKTLIWEYLKKSMITATEREISVLCETDKGSILLDDNFYYFKEELLKKICMPLTRTISFLKLKHEMHKENMIVTHETKKKNFTVNKLFLDAETGKEVRSRFIKIPKSALTSADGLCLEDIKPLEPENRVDNTNNHTEMKGVKTND